MEIAVDLKKTLRDKVEKVAGRKMNTPRDFDFLSMHILNKTRNYIAPITLKRFWGYLGEKRQTSPFRFTLDTLALYAGYIDWEDFKTNHNNSTSQSDFLPNESLKTTSLNRGDKIQLTWHPDRLVTISYEGMSMFKVQESINSKLSAGDTFLCDNIIDGEPLHLYCLVHEGNSPTNYVCGCIDGVKFKIITD